MPALRGYPPVPLNENPAPDLAGADLQGLLQLLGQSPEGAGPFGEAANTGQSLIMKLLMQKLLGGAAGGGGGLGPGGGFDI